MGAIFAAGVGIALGDGAPAAVAIPLVIIAGAIGGAFWAPSRPSRGLPGHQRDHHHPDAQLHRPQPHELPHLRQQQSVARSRGEPVPDRSPVTRQFPVPRVLQSPRLSGSSLRSLLAILAWFLISKTKWGFEVRIVGDSADTARYAGIAVPRKFLGVFLMSGAFAGLAGSPVRRRPGRGARSPIARSRSRIHRHHRGRPRPPQPDRRHPGWHSDGSAQQRRAVATVHPSSRVHRHDAAGRHPHLRRCGRVLHRQPGANPRESGRSPSDRGGGSMNDSTLILTVFAAMGLGTGIALRHRRRDHHRAGRQPEPRRPGHDARRCGRRVLGDLQHREACFLGVIVAMIAGAAFSVIHAFASVTLRVSQIVSGLALTIFGTGLSSFLGEAGANRWLASHRRRPSSRSSKAAWPIFR